MANKISLDIEKEEMKLNEKFQKEISLEEVKGKLVDEKKKVIGESVKKKQDIVETVSEEKTRGRNVFAGEDKLIVKLKKEHEKILFLAKNLNSFLEDKAISKTNCMLSLLGLKNILEKHLAVEDDELYPALEKSKDAKTRKVGKKFSKEMLGISKTAFDFLNKYSELKDSMLEKNKKFKEELRVILEVVGKRIKAEEEILFPAYLKKPLTTVAEKEAVSEGKMKEESVIEKESTEIEESQPKDGNPDLSKIASEVKAEMISDQKKGTENVPELGKKKLSKKDGKKYIVTGIPGFDDLLEKGIPAGNSLIVAGGAGSGKTIMCLQTLVNKAKEGKKGLYMTLEEREDRLIQHMEDFNWPAKELVKKGKIKIVRMNPFEITRNVDALLAQQKGELLIEVDPMILPKGFKPDFIVIDSLTAIASAFTGKDESYRIYIEQLFRFLEKTDATSFLITETEQIPKIFSKAGVEEFLADGVIVLYNLKHGNVRENALEILKLRGAAHQKKIVAMQITGEGVVVYPEQEVFSDMD
jgi:KaiC/GvpD/RAD55 family RecA-like ATPase/hemerythrin-like domain-containing protein